MLIFIYIISALLLFLLAGNFFMPLLAQVLMLFFGYLSFFSNIDVAGDVAESVLWKIIWGFSIYLFLLKLISKIFIMKKSNQNIRLSVIYSNSEFIRTCLSPNDLTKFQLYLLRCIVFWGNLINLTINLLPGLTLFFVSGGITSRRKRGIPLMAWFTKREGVSRLDQYSNSLLIYNFAVFNLQLSNFWFASETVSEFPNISYSTLLPVCLILRATVFIFSVLLWGFMVLRLTRIFGKSKAFAIGLFFIWPIFLPILAFDSSVYSPPSPVQDEDGEPNDHQIE